MSILSDLVDRVAANMGIHSEPVPPAFVKPSASSKAQALDQAIKRDQARKAGLLP